MNDRARRDAELQDEDAQRLLEIAISNLNRTQRAGADADSLRARCVYDCDCTVLGGADPVPPLGVASGVIGYGAGSL
ncbi:hypothetical protein [Phaeovulum vinaykumarii]|uniref:Uncharacterized protein n=1 Tax=Phaeovulum vinaykumarii TaxID=407234 RepID=A0A1N7JM78_9RHOB|nr:hypothetical protein [Phaeovulum vinaykumarii]SIS50407.1 hypothetical protein SAMN05421795_101152 [Phaeovulum vinaykumarii]SOB90251.1 hypothetical protein SAMN05878426_101152 [Phaeovulum vinaykumarii]